MGHTKKNNLKKKHFASFYWYKWVRKEKLLGKNQKKRLYGFFSSTSVNFFV